MEDDSPMSGAEAFRALRTFTVSARPQGQGPELPGYQYAGRRGQNFCTVNYAVSLAHQGCARWLSTVICGGPCGGTDLG